MYIVSGRKIIYVIYGVHQAWDFLLTGLKGKVPCEKGFSGVNSIFIAAPSSLRLVNDNPLQG